MRSVPLVKTVRGAFFSSAGCLRSTPVIRGPYSAFWCVLCVSTASVLASNGVVVGNEVAINFGVP